VLNDRFLVTKLKILGSWHGPFNVLSHDFCVGTQETKEKLQLMYRDSRSSFGTGVTKHEARCLTTAPTFGDIDEMNTVFQKAHACVRIYIYLFIYIYTYILKSNFKLEFHRSKHQSSRVGKWEFNTLNINIYIYIYTHTHTHIYLVHLIYVYWYIYIYIYIHRYIY
jgi:hypothetical protein